jgi:hypothetical protein
MRKAPYSPYGKNLEIRDLSSCHKCNKLGHTAYKCRRSEKFPHTRAREENEMTQVTELRVPLIVDVVTSLRIADGDRCVESAA